MIFDSIRFRPIKSTARIALFKLAYAYMVFTSSLTLAADLIVPSDKLPTAMPWDLKKLSKPPAFKWIDSSAPVRSMYYEGEPYAGSPTRVFAYFATPETISGTTEKDQRFPAVVLLHGGGGTAFREWVENWAKRGYAAIAMDLAGSRPLETIGPDKSQKRVRIADGGPDPGDERKFANVDKAPSEQWTYHAVAAAIRAHSLIRSLPEVDSDRTAVTGISWGGYLTLIVAGVDNRFKAAVPVYGCGFLHENSEWLGYFAKLTPTQRDRWVSLWDPSVYLPAIKTPIFFVSGTNDHAYPLDSYMKSYAAVSGTKQLRITVGMHHSHQDGWAPTEIGLFIDQYLRGGNPLPSIGESKTSDGKRVWKCTGTGKVRAEMHFTNDAGPMMKWDWHTQPATVLNQLVATDAPSGDATAWFITITDACNVTVSSEVLFKDKMSAVIPHKN